MLNIHQIFFYDIGHWCEQIAGDSYWIFDSQAKRYSDSELNLAIKLWIHCKI